MTPGEALHALGCMQHAGFLGSSSLAPGSWDAWVGDAEDRLLSLCFVLQCARSYPQMSGQSQLPYGVQRREVCLCDVILRNAFGIVTRYRKTL